MKAISRIALGMALALGGSAIALTPAVAKKEKAEDENQTWTLSQGVQNNLAEAQKAMGSKDYATAGAKITAAAAAIKNDDDRFQVGAFKLNLGTVTNNQALQSEGIDLAVASGKGTTAQKKELLHNQGALAMQARNPAKAEQAFTQLVALDPSDGDNIVTLAAIKQQNGKSAEALTMINQAIAAKKTSGQPVPQDWYRRGLAIAFDSKSPGAVDMSLALLQAYPNPDNWRDALMIYRQTNKIDPEANLDAMRLIRATHAMKGESDYYEYANTALQKGLPGEAKTVIDEGVAARAIDANRPIFADVRGVSGAKIAADKASLPRLEKQALAAPNGKLAAGTANAYLGYGEYPQAASLYRAALQKGGVDASEVQTRLGIALALSGDKAGAQQAFSQVTGPRASLAKYWLIFVKGPAA
jgi:tetratricopeptide (TPR) repeat protein